MESQIELEREARILLQIMLKGQYWIQNLPFNEVGLFEKIGSASKFIKKLSDNLFCFLKEQMLIKAQTDRFVLSEEASNWLNQFLIFLDVERDLLRIKKRENQKLGEGAVTHIRRRKDDEKFPIFKLYKRYQKTNQSFFDDAKLAAAIHIFALYEKAKLAPKLTMDWDRLKEARQTHFQGEHDMALSEKQFEAKKSLFDFFESLNTAYGQIIIEVCILGNGLEAIEKRNAWPQRSAKLILSLALEYAGQYFGYIDQKANGKLQLNQLFDEAVAY